GTRYFPSQIIVLRCDVLQRDILAVIERSRPIDDLVVAAWWHRTPPINPSAGCATEERWDKTCQAMIFNRIDKGYIRIFSGPRQEWRSPAAKVPQRQAARIDLTSQSRALPLRDLCGWGSPL